MEERLRTVAPEDYLMHHGVEGQKWGRRRYQNADGSLTPAGYAHYGISREGKKAIRRIEKDKAEALVARQLYNRKRNKLETKLKKAKAKNKDERAAKLQQKINKQTVKINNADKTVKNLNALQRKNIQAAKRVWNVAAKKTYKDVQVHKGRRYIRAILKQYPGKETVEANAYAKGYKEYVRVPYTKYKFKKRKDE